MVHCCFGGNVALRIYKYFWICVYFQEPRLDFKSKKNCECLAVSQSGRFKLFYFTSFKLVCTARMLRWKSSIQKRVLVLLTTVSPNCTSSGNCPNSFVPFLYQWSKEAAICSSLPHWVVVELKGNHIQDFFKK